MHRLFVLLAVIGVLLLAALVSSGSQAAMSDSVQLRVEADDGDHDVRLPFAKPVDDVTGLSQAIRILMGCPFLNGLRARRL